LALRLNRANREWEAYWREVEKEAAWTGHVDDASLWITPAVLCYACLRCLPWIIWPAQKNTLIRDLFDQVGDECPWSVTPDVWEQSLGTGNGRSWMVTMEV